MADLILNSGTTNIPLVFKDSSGAVVAPQAGGTVTSSNTSVATASLSADGGTVSVVPAAAQGSFSLVYSGFGLTANIDASLGTGATSVTFDVANQTHTA